MGEALALASQMQGLVWPNPAVGCVIVREGDIVGRGQTQFGDRPHAKRIAIDQAGARARGATLYVTLEPCCHWGKAPPCVDAIMAGVAAVHASMQDPDPRVNGGGFRRLQESGIRVSVGLGAEEAMSIMEGFLKRVACGHPLVTISSRALDAFGSVSQPFDGVLATSTIGRMTFVARPAMENCDLTPIEGHVTVTTLMQDLGRRGLTNLVILPTDPLAQQRRAAGIVDYDID
nr:bifunctional diaminohydroxyphosphoribosylaminopyrimidine deaminase/5-amino-6-(5-phosphoribosylamino)uracil reductase RibD [Sinorhizobium sp. NFACC03]